MEEYADITIVAEALNGKEALDKLTKLAVDIVLMDVDMPVMNGFETTCEIVKRFPDVKIITLTMFNEKSLIHKMLDAGVSGYLLKSVGKEELYRAIKEVFNNKQYLGGDITLSIAKPEYKDLLSKQNKITPSTPLSAREIEILKFIAQGLSNTEISQKLFISSRTVDNHRTNIMKKLDVHNIAGIIRYAIQNNIID